MLGLHWRKSVGPILILFTLVLVSSCGDSSVMDSAPKGSFSIVVIPDTQRYRGLDDKHPTDDTVPLTNSVLAAHVEWISANLESQRIAFVSHLGDITIRNTVRQWEIAHRHMDEIHGKVPYGIAVGNHDMTPQGDSSLFQQYFPASRYRKFYWYGGFYAGDPLRPGHSGNNANSYQLFTAEGINFIIVHLENNAPDAVVAWANQVMTTHAGRIALISAHMDLGPLEAPRTAQDKSEAPKGRMRWSKRLEDSSNTPEQLWDKLYRKHANLLMIFSGDQSRTSAMRLDVRGDHGKIVYGLMSDYTSSGPLRIYRILPAKNRIEVITYDTKRDEVIDSSRFLPGRENHQFVIELDLEVYR